VRFFVAERTATETMVFGYLLLLMVLGFALEYGVVDKKQMRIDQWDDLCFVS
jgi:hypothetical protein